LKKPVFGGSWNIGGCHASTAARRTKKELSMPIKDKQDDRIIRLVKEHAAKYGAKIKKIDLEKQILDIECPDENKDECAVAIQKIFNREGR
jgi:hypothetical protein